MDTVFINGLQVDAIIGVHDWERQVRQSLLLDIELAADTAGSGDDLGRVADYEAVAARASAFVIDGKYKLLETLANDLADALLREFQTPWMRLRVRKPGAVRGAESAGVQVERGRAPSSSPPFPASA